MEGGYGLVYREIMRSTDLTPEAKAIYAYLCSFAGSGTTCYPSTELMRSELQMGTDRFYKHMHYLTRKGIVTKTQERNGNKWGRTIYTLSNPDENTRTKGSKQYGAGFYKGKEDAMLLAKDKIEELKQRIEILEKRERECYMKKFKVWIYDSESGCEQPMICQARNEADARRKGNKYIRMWRLRDGSVTRVEVAVC